MTGCHVFADRPLAASTAASTAIIGARLELGRGAPNSFALFDKLWRSRTIEEGGVSLIELVSTDGLITEDTRPQTARLCRSAHAAERRSLKVWRSKRWRRLIADPFASAFSDEASFARYMVVYAVGKEPPHDETSWTIFPIFGTHISGWGSDVQRHLRNGSALRPGRDTSSRHMALSAC